MHACAWRVGAAVVARPSVRMNSESRPSASVSPSASLVVQPLWTRQCASCARSRLVLSCPTLSCLGLSCFALPRLVLPVLPCLVLPCLALSLTNYMRSSRFCRTTYRALSRPPQPLIRESCTNVTPQIVDEKRLFECTLQTLSNSCPGGLVTVHSTRDLRRCLSLAHCRNIRSVRRLV